MNKIKLFFLLLFLVLSLHFLLPLPVFAQNATDSAGGSPSVQGAQTSDPASGSLPTLPSNFPALLLPRHRAVIPSLNTQAQSGNSAAVNSPPVIEKLQKKNFRSDEDIPLTVANPQSRVFQVNVLDAQNLRADVVVDHVTNLDNAVYYISPRMHFRPGRYKIIITDQNGASTQQDFNWGVLAINPNKSVYTPQEDAYLSLAVLDETGNMVCDAKLELRITNQELGIDDTLSTDNGKIIVNAGQCKSHVVTELPDYFAHYQTGNPGTYSMTLTAVTKNGTYSITDSFDVKASVPFSVERVSATRIYPPNTYPVTLNITANQNFSGKVSEVVPDTFTISQQDNVTHYATAEHVAIVQKGTAVLGASVGKIGMPFTGTFPVTLGFGEHLLYPKEKDLYAQFGLMGHDGMDFGMPIGTPLIAVDDGTVTLAGTGPYGTTIIIHHSWGQSYYGHLSVVSVKAGQSVTRGQQIGLSGMTGITTGPHLHFGIKPDINNPANGFYGKVDPAIYLGLKQDNGAVLGTVISSLPSDEVQVLTWNVTVKKGDKFSLGYNYVAPNVSPQFYTIGPATFYNSSNHIEFQEARPWQIAVDAAQTFYLTNTAGSGSYPTTSWLLSTTNNSVSDVTTLGDNAKNTGVYQFQPGVDNTTALTVGTLPTAITNKGWVYNSTVLNSQYVASGTWTINYKYSVKYTSAPTTKNLWYRVLRVTCASGSCTQQSVISPTDASAPVNSGWSKTDVGTIPATTVLSGAQSTTFSTGSVTQFGSSDTIYVEYAVETNTTGSNQGLWHFEANTASDSIVTPNVYVPTFTQGTFNWYKNKDNLQPDTVYMGASENRSTNLKQQSNATDKIRLRMNLTEGGGDLPVSNKYFALQYATSSAYANAWNSIGSPPSTYLYRKKFTISHNKVQGGSDLSNFPVLITENSDADLKTAANGGLVQNSGGSPLVPYDMVFYASDGTTKLDYEVEKYVATSGEFETWVRIPTLSATVDTVIYVYFDNTGITTSQENVHGVWDSNYVGVWHMKETPRGTPPQDSTATGANGTYVGPWATYQQTTGQIDGALQFQATRSANVNFSDIPALHSSSFMTMEMWYKPTTTTTGYQGMLWGSNAGTAVWYLENDGSPANHDCPGNTVYSTAWDFVMGAGDVCTQDGALVNGQMDQVVAVFDGTQTTNAGKARIYVDGLNMAQVGLSGTFPTTVPSTTLTNWYMGNSFGSATRYTDGLEDEVRLSTAARTQGWIQTEFNNTATPSSFFTNNVKEPNPSGFTYRKKITFDHTKVTAMPVVDATSSAVFITNTADFTWSHTVTSTQSNTLLMVDVGEALANRVTSATYGGVALTQLSAAIDCGSGCANEVWYLKNPPTGINTIEVKTSSSNVVAVTAISYYNVDETNTFGTVNSSTGSTSPSSTVVTTNANQIVSEFYINQAGTCGVFTPGSGQTNQVYVCNTTAQLGVISTKTATGTSTTMGQTWTGPSQNYVDFGVGINGVLSNFPVLITESLDTDLETAANGGYVQNSNGYDMVFYDSSVSAKLDHEVEKYVPTTGEFETWVRIPTLSATADTSIYLYFDNSSITTSQENKTSVWDSSYVGVYHLAETSVNQNDSTTNALNFTTGTVQTLGTATGQIDGADQFSDASNNNVLNTSGDNSLLKPDNVSVEAWVNLSAYNTGGNSIAYKAHSVSPWYSYQLNVNPSHQAQFLWENTTPTLYTVSGNTTINLNTWYHLVGMYDGTHLKIYVNGVDDSSSTVTPSGTLFNSNSSFQLGAVSTTDPNGILDEIRLSKSARSSGWIATEFNNMATPSAFETYLTKENLVTTSNGWVFYDNPTPSDGTQITSTLLSTSTSGDKETYEESNPTALNPTTIASGESGEWDFSLDPTNASPGTRYYFRMVNSDGTTTNFTYNVYPSIYTAPSLDMLMRGRKWFSTDGVKQSFDL